MQKEELSLLEKICKKSNVDPNIVVELIKIEKEYANKNQARRRGIMSDLNDVLDRYLKRSEI